jgi:periplasmic protein TonB
VKRVGHTGAQGWALALALYGALLAWAFLSPPVRRASERPAPTQVRLVESRPAEPAPPPPPPPPKESPPKRMEAARSAPTKQPVAPAPLLPTPASPTPTPPAAPRRFAVSLEATVPGGGIAVPTAPPGTSPALRATPGGTSTSPDAPAYAVEPDSAPSLIAQPDLSEMRALYPESARRAGLEGDVRLELTVSATGEVTGSRVIRSAGGGFDEVAQKLVRRFRFRPATRGGKAVPATVPWTYKFRLEG